jgi:hypothetical protein
VHHRCITTAALDGNLAASQESPQHMGVDLVLGRRAVSDEAPTALKGRPTAPNYSGGY